MNLKDPAFQGPSGKKLRQAITYAHNAERFVDIIFAGRGTPHSIPLPLGLPASDPTLFPEAPTYNLKKARALLKEAGFPDGAGAPLLRLDLRDEGTTQRQAGEFLQAELKAIGLKLELLTNTYPRYRAKARQGQVQLYFGRWIGDYPDEENWLQLLYGPNASPGTNTSNFTNEAYDTLHEQTRKMTDSPARREKIHEMIRLMLAEAPWRVSFQETKYVLRQNWVENLKVADEIYNSHKYIRLKKPRSEHTR